MDNDKKVVWGAGDKKINADEVVEIYKEYKGNLLKDYMSRKFSTKELEARYNAPPMVLMGILADMSVINFEYWY